MSFQTQLRPDATNVVCQSLYRMGVYPLSSADKLQSAERHDCNGWTPPLHTYPIYHLGHSSLQRRGGELSISQHNDHHYSRCTIIIAHSASLPLERQCAMLLEGAHANLGVLGCVVFLSLVGGTGLPLAERAQMPFATIYAKTDFGYAGKWRTACILRCWFRNHRRVACAHTRRSTLSTPKSAHIRP